MSFTGHVDSAYQATRLSRAEERERECHRKDCDAPVEDSQPCAVCAVWFCPEHLFDGECAECTRVSEAADGLLEQIKRLEAA